MVEFGYASYRASWVRSQGDVIVIRSRRPNSLCDLVFNNPFDERLLSIGLTDEIEHLIFDSV